MAIIHQSSDEDSEAPNENDWNSDDEPPEENDGDERILSRDGDAKKIIRRKGKGLACPGEHDVVVVKYKVFLGEKMVAESSNPEGDKVVLGENSLPLAVEMTLRRMHVGELAEAVCTPKYAAKASPLYGQPAPKDVKVKKKNKFLPVAPDFAVASEEIDPDTEVHAHIELLSMEAVALLTSDSLVRKRIVQKGKGWRTPRVGDFCYFSLGTDQVDEENLEWKSSVIKKENLPYPGLEFVLASMKKDEKAVVSLGGHHSGSTAASSDIDVCVTCILHRWLRADRVKMERQKGTEDSYDVFVDKKELRPSPDSWSMHSVADECPLLLCLSSSSGHMAGKFAVASWCSGEGTVPDYIDAAVKSLKLHEHSEFTVPAEVVEKAPALLSFDGQTKLKQIVPDSKLTMLLSRLTAEYQGEDLLGTDEGKNEGVPSDWVTIGEEITWSDFTAAAGASPEPDGSLCIRALLVALREAPEAWSLEEEDQITYIQTRKCHGNALIKSSRFSEAYAAYKTALDACRLTPLYKAFMPTQRGQLPSTYTRDPHEKEDPLSKLTPKEAEDAKVSFISIHLNLAFCAIRRGDLNECRTQCDIVLAADGDNVKAMFRRGVASMKLGEFNCAEKELQRALELQPKDTAIMEELKRLKLAMKKHQQSEKAMYAKLFAPIQEASKTPAEEASKGGSDASTKVASSEASSSST